MKTKLILFGITGDLSTRKLLPALIDIIDSGEVGELSIIGVSRREVNIAELLGERRDVADRFSIVTMDLAQADDYVRLKDTLALQDDEQAVIYLSVPPNAAADIVDFLGEAGLNGKNVKILFEKPFGFDLASAHDFLARTERHYSDSQIYRIDHYAAKDMAQQLIRLRTNAENHHHAWSNESVASIDIVALEKIGIEGRAGFYEQTGALRDFIQGHLMQLLALVLMDAPTDLDNTRLAQYRLEALRQVTIADPIMAVRAQYEGYQDEVNNPDSRVETFAALQFMSLDPRWHGVPLGLATGKNLDAKQSAIIVNYKDGTQDIFEDGKLPIDGRQLDAYERVLIEAINGNKAIFTTGPEVIRAWELVASVQEAWALDDTPLKQYKPGSSFLDTLQLA
jgi:glucose-6-phosphate 1-dehydrogenase